VTALRGARAGESAAASRDDQGPRQVPFVDEAGNIAAFAWAGVKGIRHIRPYAAEVLRQASLIATGSVLVIMLITFLTGNSCGLESTAVSRSLGTDPAAPFFSAFCTTREVVPFVFGYILAAKVGCGIVAELGSMQVRQEVEALDVMGIRSMTYLVSTRILACAVVLPIAYAMAVAAGQVGAWLGSLQRFGDTSQGTWEFSFYQALDTSTLIYSGAKGLAISAFVLSVALYYGYTVRGGPVEVGVATARSMAVNLIGATIINLIGTFIFFGTKSNIPVA